MADYILIVEDDNDINHMLSELLSSQGIGQRQPIPGRRHYFI